MKRIAVIAGGIALALTLTVGAFAASDRFSDVRDDHPVEAIEWAAEVGITAGIGDGMFGPDEPLKRKHARVFMERFYDRVLGADGDDQFASSGFTRADMMELLFSMVDDAPVVTTTVAPTTTTTAVPEFSWESADLKWLDAYIIPARSEYSDPKWAVEFEWKVSCRWGYIEVQLLLDGRRTGQWGNDGRAVAPGTKMVVEVRFDSDWDYYEWEYRCS